MKLLLIHADSFAYQVKSPATSEREELTEDRKSQAMKNVLVAFCTVESIDEVSPEDVVMKAAQEVADVARKVGAKNVMLYPYAHLSPELAKPRVAIKILQNLEASLSTLGEFKVGRSPFGWYKGFTIECKGHPLSELSRSIVPLGAGAEALRQGKRRMGRGEEAVKERKEAEKVEGRAMEGERFGRFILVDADGSEYEVTPDNWKECPIFQRGQEVYRLLWIFVRNELEGNPGRRVPKHIDYMRKLELMDYCPESDLGNFKLYPNGALIFDLIKDYALFKVAIPWGAMKIQNPLIYRQSVEAIRQLMGEFHERDYAMEYEGETFVLRFSSDPGAFPFVQKAIFSHRHLPVKVYEEVPCFRRELSGELVGLRRLRQFTMTDQHCFCGNEDQAKEEFEKLCLIFKDLMDRVIAKGNWVLGWEGVEWFYEKHKAWLKDLCVKMGVPSFFKLTKEMTHYYAIKNEYQAIGADEANVQISTVQYDVKNGERFGIRYVAEDGRKLPCIILHASSFGSLERTLYILLENAAKDEERGKAPMLPLWLSPDQVRLIPVADRHLAKCREIAERLQSEGIRVSLDDRNLSVPKRVMDAKTSWVPYIIVLGDRELESDKLPVVVREKSGIQEEFRQAMSLPELIQEIREKCQGMPFRPSYLPMELSRRITFVPWGKGRPSPKPKEGLGKPNPSHGSPPKPA
ncbi:threonine--tRNA ligase [Candidatus Bathyarchaeota archaeon]|nr:threonine--tRNA ligase [Candidatus Bathyarchaeota archaeon]MBS7627707.1 threonine--tRNA ligase [Candidatus Bathyarchaeota archaeon]